MKNMKTDNELIAQFMDYVINPVDGGLTFSKLEDVEYIGDQVYGEWHCIDLFEKSWDWLMPVVEKINEPEVVNGKLIRSPADVTIFYKACSIKFSPDEDFEDAEEYERQISANSKIDAVYASVIGFIKWYNSQKQ